MSKTDKAVDSFVAELLASPPGTAKVREHTKNKNI